MKRILLVMGIVLSSFLPFYGIPCEGTTVTLNPQDENLVVYNSQVPNTKNRAYANTKPGVGCTWNYSSLTGIQDFVCAQGLVFFDVSSLTGIPISSWISSATLRLVTISAGVGYYPRNFHIVAQATTWDPATVTWAIVENSQYYINSKIIEPPPAYSGQTYDIDVTSIVQAWASRTWNNFGLLLGSEDYTFPYAVSFDAFTFESPQLIVTYDEPCWGPQPLTPSQGSTGISTSPTLSWKSIANADSYDVYFGKGWKLPFVGNTTSTSFSMSGLSSNTTYYWQLATRNSSCRYMLGPNWSFTTGSQGGCTYSISPGSNTLGAGAGTGSVNVTAGAGCAWTAFLDPGSWGWLGISAGASNWGGTGSGTVNYYYFANNTGQSRTGKLHIAGQDFSVTQAADSTCTFTINPINKPVGKDAGSGSVSVTAGAGCSWTAFLDPGSWGWLGISAGASNWGGTGSGTVNYYYFANNTGQSRTGKLHIAGQDFQVTQGGQ